MSVNRFSKEAKLAKHIVPPRVLDIRPFLENLESQLPSVYTLAAQIVHMGYSKDSGTTHLMTLLIMIVYKMNVLYRSLRFSC